MSDMQNMPGMKATNRRTFIDTVMHHAASGTSAEPAATPVPMLMATHGGWTVMLHGQAFVANQQQSGPRGADKSFSTNWIMPMAQHRAGPGTLTLRSMFSLEPATITGRFYPELFQQGETAFGRPLVDGQHPHDFFMELAAIYDIKINDRSLVSIYVAPVGDPALGPTAYPHRASADENPIAPLSHHQMDSTHIAYNVVTGGLTFRRVRIEASGFHGREPGEHRWGIDGGTIDSWSSRLTFNPTANWSGQFSYGRLTAPEALFPHENQERITSSVMYDKSLSHGNWTNTLAWGRTRSLSDNSIENGYLLESTLHFAKRNAVWTRLEDAGRTNELALAPRTPLPPGFAEKPIGHVFAGTLGYDREYNFVPHVATAIGAQITAYKTPDQLQPMYGEHPVGGVMFIRLRLQ
jgi:hypothetical protein